MTPPDGAFMAGSYDHPVVALSALIATLATYTALDLAGRVNAARGAIRLAWLISGAIAMGIGIWSMHFTAMLAFRRFIAMESRSYVASVSGLMRREDIGDSSEWRKVVAEASVGASSRVARPSLFQ
jgi:hypothetical protein